jgi:hypothetical protein
MIGYIGTSVTTSLNHTHYRAIADLHNLQFTVAHELGFYVFATCLLVMDLNTETSTSNQYGVILSFLLQSPCPLPSVLCPNLYSTAPSFYFAPPAYDWLQTIFVVPYKLSARTYKKHVTWSLSTVMWRRCLRGRVFTASLSSNMRPTVPLVCFCGNVFNTPLPNNGCTSKNTQQN